MSRRGGWIDPFAGQPGRRLFVAVPLDATAVHAVTAVVDEVRAQPLPAGMRDVRWVRLDGLHLTLRFLGPTADDRIAPTGAAVAVAAGHVDPTQGLLAGTGTFPAHGKPRTVWIGVREGVEELTTLASALREPLAAAGWPPDDRPFRAHLTLARTDGLAAGPLVAERLRVVLGDRVIPFAIDRVGLYESLTGGGPARYVPVMDAALGAMR